MEVLLLDVELDGYSLYIFYMIIPMADICLKLFIDKTNPTTIHVFIGIF